MKFLTRDIIDFYKYNQQNSWYLTKFFSNTKEVGYYKPFREDAVATHWNKKDTSLGTVDEINTYKINSIGCRGEIDENSDILASGCSITFGIGVPEDGRWTNFLSKKINKSVTNLGNPGASVETICTNIIQYCLTNKMPKEIFCMFPDFFRSMVVVDKEFYKSKVNRGALGTRDYLEYIYCNPKMVRVDRSVFMEIEDHKYIEDSTSPHQLILNSINFIYILESFCLLNNIKLYWTTWNTPSSWVLEELLKMENFKLKNFTSLYPPNYSQYGPNALVEETCDVYHENEFTKHAAWHNGSDYSIINGKKTFENAHPGIHFQYHAADFFYNLYKKDNLPSTVE